MINKKLVVLSSMILAGVVCSSKSEAVEMLLPNSQISKQQIDSDGLMGYYFLGNDCTDIEIFSPSAKKNLGYNQQNADELLTLIDSKREYKSILWKGNLKPNKTGEYSFSISDNYNDDTIIIVNNEIVSEAGQSLVKVKLTDSEEVPIRIIYNPDTAIKEKDLNKFKLYIFNEHKKIQVNNTQLSYKTNEKQLKNSSRELFTSRDSLDSDFDNIPDTLEENGYTIQNMVAVSWDDSLSSQGYTKYLSNKFEAHTAGDPYNDLQKASETIDQASDPAAFNPLVAANPVVTVGLEDVILSPNQNLTNSVSSSQSTNWSSSNTVGVSTTATASLTPSLSVTASYSHTTTTGQDWGSTQGNSSEFNSASAAYLNANVRYYNTGTGAIYTVQPTTNFVLENETIATIKAQGNTTAMSLGFGQTYPTIGQHGIAINTMDNFNSQPITLNSNQFDQLLNNNSPLSIETIQADGDYMIYDDNGNLTNGGSWAGIQEQIRNMTANFIVDTGEGATERNVAARYFDNPDDFTPVVNVNEALNLAYPNAFTEKTGDLPGATPVTYFNSQPFEPEAYICNIDDNTNSMIEKQLDNPKDFGKIDTISDLKLMRKMNMTFKLPMYYNIGSDNNIYTGDETKPDKSPGKWFEASVKKDSQSIGGYTFYNTSNTDSVLVFPDSVTKKLYAKDDSYYGTYMISFYIKKDPDNSSSNTTATVNINNYHGNNSLISKDISLTDEYQRVELLVYNGTNNDYISSMHISHGSNTINWNSISINKISGLDLVN